MSVIFDLNDWLNIRSALWRGLMHMVRPMCAHPDCGQELLRTDAAKVIVCGHIFHDACAEALQAEAPEQLTCPACSGVSHHAHCGHNAPFVDMQWEDSNFGKVPPVRIENGRISERCTPCSIRACADALAEATAERLNMSTAVDDGCAVYATNGTVAAWMSRQGYCFNYGGDTGKSDENPTVTAPSKAMVVAHGIIKNLKRTQWREDSQILGGTNFLVRHVKVRGEPYSGGCRVCWQEDCRNVL